MAQVNNLDLVIDALDLYWTYTTDRRDEVKAELDNLVPQQRQKSTLVWEFKPIGRQAEEITE